jgi:hypothetical protein
MAFGRRAIIELDPAQRQAIAQRQPVQIIDPLTHDAYVVVRGEEYARLTGAPRRAAGEPNSEIPPMILRAQRAFWRDLPGLLFVPIVAASRHFSRNSSSRR